MDNLRTRRWQPCSRERDMAESIPQPLEDDFLNIYLTMLTGTVTITVQAAEDRIQPSPDSD